MLITRPVLEHNRAADTPRRIFEAWNTPGTANTPFAEDVEEPEPKPSRPTEPGAVGVAGRKNNAYGHKGRGYAYLHHAVDDHSRLAYSEILADQRQETADGFWQRAEAFFATAGITVTAVMTDNGSCYRSGLFKATLGDKIKQRFTRPYRPQTNGKIERFNRTLAQEWAYAETYFSDEARAATYPDWLHYYNHH